MAKLLSDSSMFKAGSPSSRSQYEENKGAAGMTPTASGGAERKSFNSHEKTQLAAAKAGEEYRAAMAAAEGGGGGRRSPSPAGQGQGAPPQRFSGADVGDIELGAPSF